MSWKRKGGRLDFNAEYATAFDGVQLPLIFEKKSKGLGGVGIVILFGPGRGKDARAHKGNIYEAVIGTQPPAETKSQPPKTAEAVPTTEKNKK